MKQGYYHLLAIAVVVVWGLTYISTKVLIQHGLHPHEIFFYRFLVAYVGIWLIAPRRLLANSWKEEGLLALAGFFGGSLYFYTENTALGMTQASNVAFLLCTAPLLTAFLSAACYKEVRLGVRLLAGSVLALCGVGLIVFGGKEGLKVSPWGDLLTLSAAFSWACYSLVIRRLSHYPVSFITRKVFFYGLLTILPLFAIFPFRSNVGILSQSAVWMNLLFLALVASLICFVAWNVALKKIGVMHTSNYIYLSPLVTLGASMLILGEGLTLTSAVGAACILCGVYWAEKKSGV